MVLKRQFFNLSADDEEGCRGMEDKKQRTFEEVSKSAFHTPRPIVTALAGFVSVVAWLFVFGVTAGFVAAGVWVAKQFIAPMVAALF